MDFVLFLLGRFKAITRLMSTKILVINFVGGHLYD